MMRVMRCWNNRLLKEMGEVLSLEIFNARLQGSEKPNLVEGIPVHCRRTELDNIQRSL